LAPLANVSIISGRWIQSFRHLKCQNSYIISDSIEWHFFFPIQMTKICNFETKTLCYENCLNENFVCLSCCAGTIEARWFLYMLRSKGCRAISVMHVLNSRKFQNFFLAIREAVYENYKMTRSSGCCAPFLLAPARGWGALWAPNSPLGPQ